MFGMLESCIMVENFRSQKLHFYQSLCATQGHEALLELSSFIKLQEKVNRSVNTIHSHFLTHRYYWPLMKKQRFCPPDFCCFRSPCHLSHPHLNHCPHRLLMAFLLLVSVRCCCCFPCDYYYCLYCPERLNQLFSVWSRRF